MATLNLNTWYYSMNEELEFFKDEYLKKHEEDPENYPIEFVCSNAGMFDEMFQIYLETGEI